MDADELLRKMFASCRETLRMVERVSCADVLWLASLLDRPTCRNVSTLGNQDEFMCSECENGLNIGNQSSGWEPISFCPFCGAEVVG